MKMIMAKNVKPPMPKTNNANEFMVKIQEYFQSDIIDKFIASNLLSELKTKKFD